MSGYKPVGIDDDGALPPRARAAIAASTEIATVVEGAVAPVAGAVTELAADLETVGETVEDLDALTTSGRLSAPQLLGTIATVAGTEIDTAGTPARAAVDARVQTYGDAAFVPKTAAFREVDVFSSWWSTPNVWYVGEWYGRTYWTGVRRNGDLIVGYFEHRTASTKVAVIASSTRDDHNTPCLVMPITGIEDRPLVVAWTNHQADQYVRVRRSTRPADITAWGPEILVDFGTDVPTGGGTAVARGASYTQVYTNPGALNELHLFSRVLHKAGASLGNEHWYHAFSTDYGITWSTPRQVIDFGDQQHCYMIGSPVPNDGNGNVQFAIYGHPLQSTTNEIRYVSIRLQTGEVRTSAGTIGNVRTGASLPIARTALPLAVAPAAGKKIRLFDICQRTGGQVVVAYAEWDNVDQVASYKIAVRNNNVWSYITLCPTGAVIGEKPENHYQGGIFFEYSNGYRVVLARESGGTWYAEQWEANPTTDPNLSTWAMSKRFATSTRKIGRIRPVWARPGTFFNERPMSALWHDIFRYPEVDNAYMDYAADMLGDERTAT